MYLHVKKGEKEYEASLAIESISPHVGEWFRFRSISSDGEGHIVDEYVEGKIKKVEYYVSTSNAGQVVLVLILK